MSLFENNDHNIINRALVIHAYADDLGRGKGSESLRSGNSGPYVACGLVQADSSSSESATNEDDRRERVVPEDRYYGLNYDDADMPWKEFAPSYVSKVPSNLNIHGLARPDLSHDSLELKSPVATSKGALRLLRNIVSIFFFNLFTCLLVWKVGEAYE